MRATDRINRFWRNEEGLGTLEIILIIAVILIIAIAFRKWIIQWFQELLDSSNKEIKETYKDKITVPNTNSAP